MRAAHEEGDGRVPAVRPQVLRGVPRRAEAGEACVKFQIELSGPEELLQILLEALPVNHKVSR